MLRAALFGLLLSACGDSATGLSVSDAGADAGCDPAAVASCPGAIAPTWSAVDFQPQSPRTGESYGLEAYRGKVVFVAFLSGWCPYCQAQAGLLERMQSDFTAQGIDDVQIVLVNSTDAVDDQANFSQITRFPLFQDTEQALVFRKHRASKDDFALYDREGKLLTYYGPEAVRDLQITETYAAIRQRLLDSR